MSRTTVDLDPVILRKLKHIGADSGESMSRVINRLLRGALRDKPALRRSDTCFAGHTLKGAARLRVLIPHPASAWI